MANDFITLIRDLGVFGLASFFIQRIFINSSNRQLEEFRGQIEHQHQTYQNQYNQQIEIQKSQLQFLNTKLSSLHEKRLDVIKEIYDKLITLQSAMQAYAGIRPIYEGENPEEEKEKLIEKMGLAYADYNNYLLFNSIYFGKQLANKLEQVRKQYFSAQWDLFEVQRFMSMGMNQADANRIGGKKVMAAAAHIRDGIPISIQDLEDEFRKILGVEED